jgi:hypothetical protein
MKARLAVSYAAVTSSSRARLGSAVVVVDRLDVLVVVESLATAPPSSSSEHAASPRVGDSSLLQAS